jgi:asparagine synthase (glutamine-hydrolysing)
MHFLSEFMLKVDNGTMYHGLEARAPFLDQRLWEFAASLPPEVHFEGGHLKAVLREIVRRHLGPQVAFRRKQGFTVPVERWLAERWRGALTSLREQSRLEREGWLAPGSLRPAIDQALAAQHVPLQLWFVLALENWLAMR